MTKAAQVVGWVVIFMIYTWLVALAVVSIAAGVAEPPDGTGIHYYWECRASVDNPIAPWRQVISEKADNPDSCGARP